MFKLFNFDFSSACFILSAGKRKETLRKNFKERYDEHDEHDK